MPLQRRLNCHRFPSEKLDILVTCIDESRQGQRFSPRRTELYVIAIVKKAHRSASALSAGKVVEIKYTITAKPRGWIGPSDPLKVKIGERYRAYLNAPFSAKRSQVYDPAYSIAAGGKSFTRLVSHSHDGVEHSH